MSGRKLILALLMMAALPAFAGHEAAGRPGLANRELVVQARRLEDAARDIRHTLPSRPGRSPVARDARLLAEAAGRFRQRAERGAPLPRLADSYRRVGARHRQLERRLHDARRFPEGTPRTDVRAHGRDRGHRGVHREFDRAYARAGEALKRQAWRERANRSRYASDERFPDGPGRRHRDRREPGRDHR
jgi:hypothetical protein